MQPIYMDQVDVRVADRRLRLHGMPTAFPLLVREVTAKLVARLMNPRVISRLSMESTDGLKAPAPTFGPMISVRSAGMCIHHHVSAIRRFIIRRCG